MGMTISKPYRFIILSEDIEELKKMREYNNQVIPNKSTAIAVDNNEQFIFQDGKWKKMTIKMSIDEAITWLNTDDYESKGFADATSVAIDTMRKYQKIEQILKDIPYGGEATVRRIQEVIEDGKID